jgi:ubiquinone/menaquinone biosynthesis C-methylase UbiE
MIPFKKILKNTLSYFILVGLSSIPPSVQAQLGKRPAKDYIAVLENPERIERLKTSEVMSRLELKNGDIVADIGAGSGVFTRKLAQAVAPDGMVFAVDVDQELLDYNRKRIREAKLDDVEFVLGGFDDPKLPPDSCDLIFICDVVHHIEHRELYLRKLRSYVKREGRLAIIDYKTNWPPGHEEMKYSTEELLSWTKSAGFEKSTEFDLIPDAFFYIFRPVQH